MNKIAQILKRKDEKWMCNLIKIGDFFANLIENVILKKETAITDEILLKALLKDDEFIDNIPDKKLLNKKNDQNNTFWNEVYDLNKEYEHF